MPDLDPLSLLRTARDEFERRLDLVTDEHWSLPTPCDGWSVRQLVEHLVGGSRMGAALLAGASAEEGMQLLFGTTVDGDPKVAFAEAIEAQEAAFAADGAAERIVHHPRGDMPGAVFAGFRARDTAIHAWDLARAIGADEQLDDELVATIWADVAPNAASMAASGMFGDGPSGLLGDGASTRDRLLDALGRRP